MSLFIESICCLNHSLRNLSFHQQRLNETHQQFFPDAEPICLATALQVPLSVNHEKHKVRVVYGEKITEITVEHYQPKPFNTLVFVDIDPSFCYAHKSTDRTYLSTLVNKYKTDDLILVKNDHITDSTIANLVFYDGLNWVTPTTYLLKGTMRSYLLSTGQIIERKIKKNDLKHYTHVKRINALMNLNETPPLFLHHG